MPALVAWLLGALETTIGSIAISALLSLGLGYTTYKFTVAPLRDFIARRRPARVAWQSRCLASSAWTWRSR